WHFIEDEDELVIDGELPDWSAQPAQEGGGASERQLPPWYHLRDRIFTVTARPGAKARTCRNMFADCRILENIKLDELDTSEVRDMTGMFRSCSSLINVFLYKLDVSGVRQMYGVFENCSELRTVDISKWDVSSVEDFSRFFRGCGVLDTLYLNRWQTKEGARVDGFFEDCGDCENVILECHDMNIIREARKVDMWI
ncbi:MAG: BspA family leucine-rich repeat surface protein, partial [Firmicutes bacterium]|nr:BspA family leucine-rich repeat surface protein [Bacillota bacterium]